MRPYTGLHVLLYYNGRTIVHPYTRYTSRFDTTDAVTFDTTDAQIVRPYTRYSSRFDTTNARAVHPNSGLHVSCVRLFRQSSRCSELRGYSGRASICARIVSPRSFLRLKWSCTSMTKALSS